MKRELSWKMLFLESNPINKSEYFKNLTCLENCSELAWIGLVNSKTNIGLNGQVARKGSFTGMTWWVKVTILGRLSFELSASKYQIFTKVENTQKLL